MKEFTTEVDIQSHELHVRLPDSIEPGRYTITLVPMEQVASDQIEASTPWSDLRAIANEFMIQAPAGWRFNRDEAQRQP